ncbi:MAG: FKBP-type peptidyl-prolyl cis-trans isomerase [Pseudohongiellaceae bacterium]|jgi:FKBP-type peptidyl-prolyl cis-trans isomerase SlpA
MTQSRPEGLLDLVQLDAVATLQPAPGPDIDASIIGPGRRVQLHFALELEGGEIIDSCYGREPAVFDVGDGSLLPGFEQCLFGMQAGETRDALLRPEQAFGVPAEGNIQRFPRFRFPPDLQLSEGLVIDFADSNGYSQAGVVRSCDSQWVRIDFNHPLAGKTIRFRASIVNVQAASGIPTTKV